MQQKPPVNLDTLVRSAGEVSLRGRTYTVQPIDGVGYQLAYQVSTAEGFEAVELMYRAAARCLPAMTEDEVRSLVPKQVEAVVAIASGAVRAVEEAAGNPSKAGAKRARRTPSPA